MYLVWTGVSSRVCDRLHTPNNLHQNKQPQDEWIFHHVVNLDKGKRCSSELSHCKCMLSKWVESAVEGYGGFCSSAVTLVVLERSDCCTVQYCVQHNAPPEHMESRWATVAGHPPPPWLVDGKAVWHALGLVLSVPSPSSPRGREAPPCLGFPVTFTRRAVLRVAPCCPLILSVLRYSAWGGTTAGVVWGTQALPVQVTFTRPPGRACLQSLHPLSCSYFYIPLFNVERNRLLFHGRFLACQQEASYSRRRSPRSPHHHTMQLWKSDRSEKRVHRGHITSEISSIRSHFKCPVHGNISWYFS